MLRQELRTTQIPMPRLNNLNGLFPAKKMIGRLVSLNSAITPLSSMLVGGTISDICGSRSAGGPAAMRCRRNVPSTCARLALFCVQFLENDAIESPAYNMMSCNAALMIEDTTNVCLECGHG